MSELSGIPKPQGRNHASKVGGPNRAKPESRAKPEKERGKGSREGARWALFQQIFGISNYKSFNLVYSWKGNLEKLDFSKKT